jgi:hypothetical protein
VVKFVHSFDWCEMRRSPKHARLIEYGPDLARYNGEEVVIHDLVPQGAGLIPPEDSRAEKAIIERARREARLRERQERA